MNFEEFNLIVSMYLRMTTLCQSIQKHPNVDVDLIKAQGKKNAGSNVIFSPEEGSICQNLNDGRKVDIAFATCPSISRIAQEEILFARLGVVTVEWSPVPLKQSELTSTFITQSNDEYSNLHGPLPLAGLQTLKYQCPSCHIEKAPFNASFKTIPDIPKVGNPFEVRYIVTNQTKSHQRLRVVMNDSESTFPSNSMLISGLINCEIVLGPNEEKSVSYSLLVTQAGMTSFPAPDISSLRYNTWIVHGSCMNKVFVSP